MRSSPVQSSMVRYGTVQYGTAQYTGQYGREELVVVVCGGKSGGRSGGASLATVRASIHPSLSKPAFAYCCTLTKYFCNTSTAQPQSAIKHTKQINFDSQISAKHRTLIILSESENAAVKMVSPPTKVFRNWNLTPFSSSTY